MHGNEKNMSERDLSAQIAANIHRKNVWETQSVVLGGIPRDQSSFLCQISCTYFWTDSRYFCMFWLQLDVSLIVDTKNRQSYIPLT